MGAFESHEQEASVKPNYSEFLTADEERSLEKTYENHSNGEKLEDILNDPPSFILVNRERDLASLSSFKEFAIKLLRTSHRDTTELVWNSIKSKQDTKGTELIHFTAVEYFSRLITYSTVNVTKTVIVFLHMFP